MTAPSIDDARAALGDDVLGPDDVQRVFGPVPGADLAVPVPFGTDELASARQRGEMLVLRVTRTTDAPLTILSMIEHFPDAFDPKLLRTVGYQLKDEWGIALEPLAATDTCSAGWSLIRKEILDESRNLPYDDQDAAVERYASSLGADGAVVRRRSAVEAIYDTVLYFKARRIRLLERAWDWSGSRTIDGGYLNVGGFTSRGMQILAYSKAIRHGGLGICPTRHAVR